MQLVLKARKYQSADKYYFLTKKINPKKGWVAVFLSSSAGVGAPLFFIFHRVLLKLRVQLKVLNTFFNWYYSELSYYMKSSITITFIPQIYKMRIKTYRKITSLSSRLTLVFIFSLLICLRSTIVKDYDNSHASTVTAGCC